MTDLTDQEIEYLCEEFDYCEPRRCDHCGTIWEQQDYPVCPKCNQAVLEALEVETAHWLENLHRKDVLHIDVAEDGTLSVSEYDL